MLHLSAAWKPWRLVDAEEQLIYGLGGPQMQDQPNQIEHVFRYKKRTVRLICSVDSDSRGLRLILDDVLATSQRIADAVPDWRIDLEASKAACDRNVLYK